MRTTLRKLKKIEKMAKNNAVTAVKISSHFHKLSPADEIIYNSEELQVIVENAKDTGKDSARMLQAGAEKVYYIQARESALPTVISFVKEFNKGVPVICESGGMIKYLTPACFIIMDRSNVGTTKKIKEEYYNYPHLKLDFEKDSLQYWIDRIDIRNGVWQLDY